VGWRTALRQETHETTQLKVKTGRGVLARTMMAEGLTHEPFTGFVMMASCTSRLAFVSTNATMARTTGKRRMKSRAIPRGMRIIWEMMNQRLLYNGGFGSASLTGWSGSTHTLELSLASSAPERGAGSAAHNEQVS